MALNDPLAQVLSHIMAENKQGKKQVVVKPVSKTIIAVLNLLKENNYLGEINKIEDGREGRIEVNLIGTINKVGVIKPRYSVKNTEFPKFEARFLPAHGFGVLIVSTNKGIMTHEKAMEKNLGGRLLAFVY